MDHDTIQRRYHQLSHAFQEESFGTVHSRCRDLIRTYYACFPFLLQMGILYLNHHTLPDTAAARTELLEEALTLFMRIRQESNDLTLVNQATSMQAITFISLNRPTEALELLPKESNLFMQTDTLRASAYIALGDTDQAKSAIQVGLLQRLTELLEMLTTYQGIHAGDPPNMECIYQRTSQLMDAFGLTQLAPTKRMMFLLTSAHGWMVAGDHERTLTLLQEYACLAQQLIFPLQLKGDDFFDLVEDWIADQPLGKDAPRGEEFIRADLIDAVLQSPAFQTLHDDVRYKQIENQLLTIA